MGKMGKSIKKQEKNCVWCCNLFATKTKIKQEKKTEKRGKIEFSISILCFNSNAIIFFLLFSVVLVGKYI